MEKFTIGQINRDSTLGNLIFTLTRDRQDIKTIVESGTWNGLGSTRCVLDALREDQSFYSVELYSDMYAEACENNQRALQDSRVKFLHGSVITYEDMFWFDHSKIDMVNDVHAALWFTKDLNNLRVCNNVLADLPEKIDMLILDGGEYSTYPEWQKLKSRTKMVVLDDTSIFKCAKIVEELSSDSTYTCLITAPNERNGFAIYEKNS